MNIKTAQKIIKLFTASLLLVLVICLVIGILSHAHAQQFIGRSVTIVPPSKFISLSPGDKSEGTLKVSNNGEETLTFTVGVQDFVVSDTQGTPNLIPPNTLSKRFSASSWIAVYPSSFIIPPHQKQILNYYVQVPLYARPGGHYAAIIYTPSTPGGDIGSGPAVKTEIGSLFSLDVAGPIREQAIVNQFTAGLFHENGPVTIKTQIQNYGDLHIKPQGIITISNILGVKVAEIPLDEHNIFPEAARDYTNSFGRHWMIGRFEAKLLASYGRNNNLPLVASVSFIIFPWKVALVVILVIVALALGYLYWKRKNISNPHSHETTEEQAPLPIESK